MANSSAGRGGERTGRVEGRRRRRERVALVTIGALLVTAVAVSGRLVPKGLLDDRQAVGGRLVRDVRLIDLLYESGLLQLEPLPPDPQPADGYVDPWTRHALSTRAAEAGSLPSSRQLPADLIASGVPIVSLAMVPASSAQLRDYPLLRGPLSQVPGFVSLYRDGDLTAASAVGVRLHGNSSRYTPRKSYRVYFPAAAKMSSAALGWEGDPEPIGEAVLHADRVTGNNFIEWHFSNPLACDIANRIGCITPRTSPALFFINGERIGAFTITERINDSFFARRGLTPLTWHSVRDGRRGDPSSYHAYEGMWDWLRADQPMTFEEAAARVDLDNLTRWYISVLFSSTLDAYQGIAARRLDVEPTRWFWVNWDMDLSFFTPQGWGGTGWGRPPSRLRMDKWGDPRAVLLQRLVDDSREYRHYLGDLYLEVTNFLLTPEFLEERVAYYEDLARRLDVHSDGYFGGLRFFFDHRPGWLRRELRSDLKMAISPVRLASPAGARVRIDGYDVGEGFAGFYRRGDDVRLEISTCRDRHSHWLVNGERRGAGSPTLEIEIKSKVDVRPVFVGPCGGSDATDRALDSTP